MGGIGIIGGSGLYEFDGLEDIRTLQIDTPFGAPSDKLVTGRFEGVEVVFISRHGRGHRLLPSEVPYRANIYALKSLGVESVLSISAVGSMREEIKPGHMVLADQFVDRTRQRASSFFGDGIVAHVSVADPVCRGLRNILDDIMPAAGVSHHARGTYVCIEGPAFSTRAESHIYRSWGIDIIGMTAIPECKLAREAELHYATVALVTDYDCWHDSQDAVSAAAVLETVKTNTDNVKKLVSLAIPKLHTYDSASCQCPQALEHAIMTSADCMSDDAKENLGALLHKYV